VKAEQIAVDPGLGFSKNTEENCILLKNIKKFTDLAPVLIGASRKRFVRELAEIDLPADSDPYSAFIAAQSVIDGAGILRVHNVRETLKVLNMIEKIRS
jgi:dihydropteroate synthase